MDIKLIEEGNGGEIVYEDLDIQTIDGLGNQIYLALFGGNPGYITPTERPVNEQAFDFWGNTFLEESQQFNSRTEYALANNALSSQGRAEIEKAVKKDLDYLSEFANIDVVVTIDSPSRLSIEITLQEPDNIENAEYRFIWDASSGELTTE